VQGLQLMLLMAIETQYRPLPEIAQVEFTQPGAAFALQQRAHGTALFSRDEGDRGLCAKAQQTRAIVRRQPELQLGSALVVVPVSSQDKTLL
jgi:hypothetical protein